MTNFSLDSQPYAVVDDPNRLNVVSLPGRQALLQRITVNGLLLNTLPNRLRVLVRAETDRFPVAPLEIRVTDTAGQDILTPQRITPDVLVRPKEWRWFEVPLEDWRTLRKVSTEFLLSGEGNSNLVVSDGTHAYFGTNASPGRVIKYNLGTASRVAALTLNSGENILRSGITDGTHGYFGTNTSPGIVVKVDLATMTRVSALTLNSGENTLRSAVTDGAHGYFGTNTNPGIVVKVDLATMTRVGAVTLNSGENQLHTAITDGTYGYFGTNTNPGQIVKVDLATMTRVDVLTLNSGESSVRAAITDGIYGYVVVSTPSPAPNLLVKFDLATMQRVDDANFSVDDLALGHSAIDGSSGFFVSGFPPRVIEFDLSSMTRLGATTLTSEESTSASAAVFHDGHLHVAASLESLPEIAKVAVGRVFDTYVWFSVSERGPGWELAAPNTGENVREWRGPIDPANPSNPVFGELLTFPAANPVMSRTNGAMLSPEIGPVAAGEVVDDAPVFVGASPPDTFRNALLRTTDWPNRNCVRDGDFLYVARALSPGRLSRFRASDLALLGSVQMNSGENVLSGVTVSGNFAYCTTEQSPSKVIKINISGTTMQRVAVRNLLTNENNARHIVNDGTHVYVATRTNPIRVVKIRMSDMLRIGGLQLQSGENQCAGLAVSGTDLYVLTGTAPFKIVKVDTSTMQRDPNPVTGGAALGGAGQGMSMALAPNGLGGLVGTTGGVAFSFATNPFSITGDDNFFVVERGPLAAVAFDSQGYAAYGVDSGLGAQGAMVRRWEFVAGLPFPRATRFMSAPDPRNVAGIALDQKAVYFTGGSSESGIGKMTTSAVTVSEVEKVSLINSQVLEVDFADVPELPVGVHVDGQDVFLANDSTGLRLAKVVKYNKTSGTRSAELVLPRGARALAADASSLYVADRSTRSAVLKITKTNFVTTGNISLSDFERVAPGSVVQDSTNLYFGCDSNPGRVVKVAKAAPSVARDTGMVLNAGENQVTALALNGTNLYACTNTAPVRIIRIDTATMANPTSPGDRLTLLEGENFARGAAIVYTGSSTLLYVLTGTDPAVVVEINVTTSTMTRTNAIPLEDFESFGSVLLEDSGTLWAGFSTRPGRVAKLNKLLNPSGVSYAVQINDVAGPITSQNRRKDADVSMQLGVIPPRLENVEAVVGSAGVEQQCPRKVTLSWTVPDNACASMTDGGYVEIERETPFGWVSVFKVFEDVVRTVTDVEVARNKINRYRLRIVNNAGFESKWTSPVDVFVASECCGYVFSSNELPELSVWYDDIEDRSYRFLEQVDYVEFEGRDGAVALRGNSDRLDEFDATLMIAGLGVSGGTRNTNELNDSVGRRAFSGLTELAGNKRTATGRLLRPQHIAVSDDKGNTWLAEVETSAGQIAATPGRYVLSVRVRETSRAPLPIEIRSFLSTDLVEQQTDLGSSGPQPVQFVGFGNFAGSGGFEAGGSGLGGSGEFGPGGFGGGSMVPTGGNQFGGFSSSSSGSSAIPGLPGSFGNLEELLEGS